MKPVITLDLDSMGLNINGDIKITDLIKRLEELNIDWKKCTIKRNINFVDKIITIPENPCKSPFGTNPFGTNPIIY